VVFNDRDQRNWGGYELEDLKVRRVSENGTGRKSYSWRLAYPREAENRQAQKAGGGWEGAQWRGKNQPCSSKGKKKKNWGVYTKASGTPLRGGKKCFYFKLNLASRGRRGRPHYVHEQEFCVKGRISWGLSGGGETCNFHSNSRTVAGDALEESLIIIKGGIVSGGGILTKPKRNSVRSGGGRTNRRVILVDE